MGTHQRGIGVAEAIAAEHGIELHELRPYASDRLAQEYEERCITDADIGSSDVSIKLSDLALHEPEALRAEAALVRDRNELVARVAASTGRSPEVTLENLRRLFAETDRD